MLNVTPCIDAILLSLSSQLGLAGGREGDGVTYPGTAGVSRTRTRTNTNPNDTEANAAGRSGNARALRKQSKCGVYHEGEGHWPKFSQQFKKARHLWVARTPQKQ